MAVISVMNVSDQERRASDRRKATMAARLLASCLGIEVEPAFDVSNPLAADTARVKADSFGDGLYKDIFDMGARGESPELQLLVVDEKGLIKAESKQLFSLGQALDLLERLPLALSPRAPQWLKDCLGENDARFSETAAAKVAPLKQIEEVIKPC